MHERAVAFRECARERHGLDVSVQEFPGGTETAEDAAAAIGCDVGQIASSLVFVVDGSPVVVIASGKHRVDAGALGAALDAPADAVELADPETVRDVTGWTIGGVPPFCHDQNPPVVLDGTLAEFEMVWAAAGTPSAVFPTTLREIRAATGGETAVVTD